MGPEFLRRAVFAADPNSAAKKKTLICIFQRGAADGLSMVVPHADSNLYTLRPNLAIPRPGAGRGDSAIDIDGFFGLHPALAPFVPIFKSGHLAIVHACGSPNSTRSHFDAQDYMESGAPGNKGVADGWLSRAILACPEDRQKLATPLRAVAIGGAMPRILQGEAGALAIPDLRSFGVASSGGSDRRRPNARRPRGEQSNADTEMMAAALSRPTVADGFETLYDQAVGDVLHGTGKESFEAIASLKRINPGNYTPARGANYPNGRFGESLKQIAQLVKAGVGLEVAFADTGGWDTHANQGTVQGQLATRLREFGQGVAALYTDLGDQMSDVVILTMSEFGRTARQNGTGGTDHGHGTAFFVLGGDVNGGKVLGKWPGLEVEQLHERRDLAITTDFRLVFAEAAQKHLGAAKMEKIFPGFAVNPSEYRGILKG
jgi:uncharacterized protein (DUF1501 family)